jgi:hypothetical protein
MRCGGLKGKNAVRRFQARKCGAEVSREKMRCGGFKGENAVWRFSATLDMLTSAPDVITVGILREHAAQYPKGKEDDDGVVHSKNTARV